jgi:CoA:oxalate CoA-transferase
MVVSVKHLGEEIEMVGNPIKMSAMGKEEFKGAPTLGQHTKEILSNYLGFSEDQIAKLKKEKVI